MRVRFVLLLLLGVFAVAVAGCGGGEEVSPLPDEVEGDVPTETEPEDEPAEEEPAEEEPADEPPDGEGDPQRGLEVFASAGCGGCHVLEEAGTAGTVGPNLDETDTPFDEAIDVITHGRGAMPAFGDQLTEQQIRDVAALVSDS
jgi:mono/diheme cytochrome c family protein